MNIQYDIERKFDSSERDHSMVVNAHFCTRQTNGPHETPEYGPIKFKFEVDYYIETYFSIKSSSYHKILEKEGQEVIYSFTCFNSNYM